MAQTVKNLPAMQETWVWSLDQEDPVEKGMATHSRILSWRIPWTEEWGGGSYSPWGCKESDTIEWLTPTKHSNFSTISIKALLTRRCIWSSELPQCRCEVGGQWDTIDTPLRSTKSGIRICCILPTYISHLSHFFCVLFLMVYQHLHQTVTEEDKAQTK